MLGLGLGIQVWVGRSGAQRVGSGVWLSDIALSRATRSQAQVQVRRFAETSRNLPLRLVVDKTLCVGTPSELGISVAVNATLQRVMAARSGPVRVALDLDQRLFGPWLAACEARALPDPPRPGGLSWDGQQIIIQPPAAGRRIVRDRVVELLAEGMSRNSGQAIVLPVSTLHPSLTRAALDEAKKDAESLIRAPIHLSVTATDADVQVSRRELGGFLTFEADRPGALRPRFAVEPVRLWLERHSEQLIRPARDATYRVDAKGHLVAVPEQPGVTVSPEQLAAVMEQVARTEPRRGVLPVGETTAVRRTVADLPALGIEHRWARFATRFHCCQPRVLNIHRIAELMNGVIIKPQETFSVNQTIGPRTVGRGFVAAPSIEDGEMVETVGGGISQFATTLYNAVLRAGLPILERQAHTYWFERYPMGHEATLSWPKPDLVFQNDSAYGILIATRATDTEIMIEVYGGPMDRKVTLDVSRPQDIVQPPLELLPNPELPPDEEKVRDGGRIGWTVTTLRTVRWADGTERTDRRKVTYKPQVRRVDVHPCRIPPGEPGHSEEPCPEPDDATDTLPLATPVDGAAASVPSGAPPGQDAPPTGAVDAERQ